MGMVKENELKVISAAIDAVEKNTDAELVVVLAKQADDYRYIPTLWAALMALLVPAVSWASGWWLDTLDILMVQLGSFAILAMVFRLPAVMLRLVPSSVKSWRASNLARRQFLDNNLHHTRQDCGVLVFISEAEHYVEIIADRGISRHVSVEQWQSIVDSLISEIKNGATQQGLITCINSCGQMLAHFAPATQEKNELPNHLIVLG